MNVFIHINPDADALAAKKIIQPFANIARDTAIILDCSNLERVEQQTIQIKQFKKAIIIDHHETMPGTNWEKDLKKLGVNNVITIINPEYPSTTWLLWKLGFTSEPIEMIKGLVGDTYGGLHLPPEVEDELKNNPPLWEEYQQRTAAAQKKFVEGTEILPGVYFASGMVWPGPEFRLGVSYRKNGGVSFISPLGTDTALKIARFFGGNGHKERAGTRAGDVFTKEEIIQKIEEFLITET
jgi:nanoRNase/pAp phosphatase (c-di-AMP/oligoRNAs hydrolase)